MAKPAFDIAVKRAVIDRRLYLRVEVTDRDGNSHFVNLRGTLADTISLNSVAKAVDALRTIWEKSL